MNRLLISALALVMAGPAAAADLYAPHSGGSIKDEPYQRPHLWTGLSFGVHAGANFNPDHGNAIVFDNDLNGAYDNVIPAFGQNFTGSFDSSFEGGFHLGYDWQMGNAVIGVIADVSFSNTGDSQSGFSATPAFYTFERDLDTLFTLRARLGYLFTPRMLGYVSGGMAYGEVEHRFLSDTPATVVPRGGSDDNFGYTVGGGLEYMVTENFYIGSEYLYTDLGEDDFVVRLGGVGAFTAGNPLGTDTRGADRDFDFHTIRIKAGYRF